MTKAKGRLSLMFLGAPGVGKGTYASRAAPLLGIPQISTGDLIRAEIKAKTPLGAELATFTTAGTLVPDRVVLRMVKDRVAQADCAKGYLLDGFPRTVAQAETLHAWEPLRLVVNITLKEEFLMQKIMGRRVCSSCNRNYNVAHISQGEYQMPPLLPKHGDATKCDCGGKLEQRADDREETVRNRLRVYEKETAPLIGFYSKLGVLRDFDVKKGLDDFPKLVDMMSKELGVKLAYPPSSKGA